MLKYIKRWGTRIVISSMVLSSTLAPINVLADTTFETIKIEEKVITRGALLQEFNINTAKGKIKVFVTKIDLKDPYIKLDTIYGTNGQLAANQNILKMATENKAISAINGDFFVVSGEGSPLGPMVKSGEWITTPAQIEGMNAFAMTKSKEPILAPFTFNGKITTKNGQTYPVTSINKSIYYYNGGNNLTDQINIYDSRWNLLKWVGNQMSTYYVVVVENGVVKEVLDSKKPTAIPANGYVMLAHGKAATFLKENAAVGENVQFDTEYKPVNDWSFVMGGHTLLVKDGKRAAYTRDVSSITGTNARTAIGYSKDKSTLYWITTEYSKSSKGMTLEELADFMIQIGVDQGVNLDGGGSTTLVTRNPGEFGLSLVNLPKDGYSRPVPNGLALYSTAPQGVLKDVIVSLPKFLLKGEGVTTQLKGIDQYYNPVKIENQKIIWTSKNNLVQIDNNQLIGKTAGLDQLQVTSDQMAKTFSLEVVGRDQIQSFDLGVPVIRLNPNEKFTVKPILNTKSKNTRFVPTNLLNYQLIGIEGKVEADGTVIAGSKPGAGWLIATYDQFSAMVPVVVGTESKLVDGFEKTDRPLLFTGLPNETIGEFKLEGTDKKEGKYSGRLTYDFTNSKADLSIAYGKLGEKGVTFASVAKGIQLWVNGDNSGHWLRAELVDKNGQVHLITLADKVNWTGWKEINIDFSGEIDSPTLNKIYAVKNNSTIVKGNLLFDNIKFKTWNKVPSANDATLKLYINKNYMLVNEQKQTIDQAPIIVENRSYIPARFLTEALGGNIYWNPTNQNVRIVLGEDMIDLFIGDKDHTIVNGVNQPSDVAPIIRNQRTLIPVRMVTENLGYKVGWNNGEIIISK